MTKKDTRLWYERTEKLLFLYPIIDKAIRRIETIIVQINIGKIPSNVITNRNKGILNKDDQIQAKVDGLRAQKEVVSAIYERLSEDEKELIQKWYFEDWGLKKKDVKIWQAMNMNKTTFYRHKNKIISKIAEWLGELDIKGVAPGERGKGDLSESGAEYRRSRTGTRNRSPLP